MHLLSYLSCLALLSSLKLVLSFEKYRLPINIRPIYYHLNLTILPENPDFVGLLLLTIDVKKGSPKELFLHADGNFLKINTITKGEEKCNFTLPNEETQIFSTKCPTDFKTIDTLSISYRGNYSTAEMNGLYKSTYDNGSILVTSLLQPVYARKAFPCFDEPSFKANFILTIIHPTRYKVIANTPLSTAFSEKHLKVSKFEETPVMSPYLVAFIVSEYQSAFAENAEYNVFARPSAKDNTGTAKKYMEKLFDAMSEWIGISYKELGNSQAYMAAIPDFSAGAMENWGLITFREADFLDEGNRTGVASLQTIVVVMAHEIVHQWFGNYVTLNWWSDIWLNEGFATYFSHIIADKVTDGKWELQKQFVADDIQSLLQKDAKLTSVAISLPEKDVNSPLDINSNFDVFAYHKGAAIIRMMRNVMGERLFKKGLQQYLKEYRYADVCPEDLLTIFQGVTEDYDFEDKMSNWINTPGFPLLTVKQVNKTTITITQKRFFTNRNFTTDDQWFVPLSYTNETEKDFYGPIKGWLEPNKTYEIAHDEGSWFILNLKQSGYYRVHYDDILLNNIIKAVHDDKKREFIDILNRAQVIDDTFQLARVGKISYTKAFELVKYLKKEKSILPWQAALREFKYILQFLEEKNYMLLMRFILNMIQSAFPKGTEYISHMDLLTENVLFSWRCGLNEPESIALVKKQFEDFRLHNGLLDLNKIDDILCHGLMTSDDVVRDFNFLLDVHKKSQSSTEQNSIIIALGCMQNEENLWKYLNLTLIPDSQIRQQDFPIVFNTVYFQTRLGTKVALEFLEKNLMQMEEKYGGGSLISNLLIDFAGKLSTQQHIKQMKKIIKKYAHIPNVERSRPIIMEIIYNNYNWNNENRHELYSVLVTLAAAATSTFNFNVYTYMFVGFYSLYILM